MSDDPPLFAHPGFERRFPCRATHWQFATQRLALGDCPLIMGILNVTPDSFSDGGQFVEHGQAIEHGLRLAAAGAAILDVGGESTRPYSQSVDAKTELARVIPVVAELARQTSIPISIDTSKSLVAREAIAAGAQIINDVTGLQGDPDMVAVASQSRAGVCVMHMQGTPQTMQDNPTYGDVVDDVTAYLKQRRDDLTAAGIAPERIALDPGIGFGKTNAHNLRLSSQAYRLHELGCPVLVGHSRKRFLAKVLGQEGVDLTAATIGVALSLASQGVQIIRVHDVAAVQQALQLFAASGGLDNWQGGPRSD